MQAPIYVNKQIVLADAIRISYGTGRVRDTKPIYDVLLDRYFLITFNPVVSYSLMFISYAFLIIFVTYN